jgi:hypothetical protein
LSVNIESDTACKVRHDTHDGGALVTELADAHIPQHRRLCGILLLATTEARFFEIHHGPCRMLQMEHPVIYRPRGQNVDHGFAIRAGPDENARDDRQPFRLHTWLCLLAYNRRPAR